MTLALTDDDGPLSVSLEELIRSDDWVAPERVMRMYSQIEALRDLDGRRGEIARKVLSRCLFDPYTGCMNWQGPTSGDGRGGDYARMSLDGQTVAVHRVMWTLVHGYIPGKKHLDHHCRNRRCVNPWHTEMVTHKENCRRRDGKVKIEWLDTSAAAAIADLERSHQLPFRFVPAKEP